MIDTVIVSGGMIQKDFALDFIRKIEEERKGKKLLMLRLLAWNKKENGVLSHYSRN